MSFKLTFFVISLISSLSLAQSASNTVTCKIDPTYLVKSAQGRDGYGGVPYKNGVALSPEIKIKVEGDSNQPAPSGEGFVDLIIGRTSGPMGTDLTEDNHYRLVIRATVQRDSSYSELDVRAVLMEKNSAGDYEVLADIYHTMDTESLIGREYSPVIPVVLNLENPKSTLNVVKKGENVFSSKPGLDSLRDQRKNYLAEVRVSCEVSK